MNDWIGQMTSDCLSLLDFCRLMLWNGRSLLKFRLNNTFIILDCRCHVVNIVLVCLGSGNTTAWLGKIMVWVKTYLRKYIMQVKIN